MLSVKGEQIHTDAMPCHDDFCNLMPQSRCKGLKTQNKSVTSFYNTDAL